MLKCVIRIIVIKLVSQYNMFKRGVVKITEPELRFIEDLGLLFEISNGSKTMGRVFGYLLLADRPKTLDDIASALMFSKATASLTMRQGLLTGLFEKVSLPGERKTLYRANTQSWINAMTNKMNSLHEWEKLIETGLGFIIPGNQAARDNLTGLKDYFDFLNWYLTDFTEEYTRWKKGAINPTTPKKAHRPPDR